MEVPKPDIPEPQSGVGTHSCAMGGLLHSSPTPTPSQDLKPGDQNPEQCYGGVCFIAAPLPSPTQGPGAKGAYDKATI